MKSLLLKPAMLYRLIIIGFFTIILSCNTSEISTRTDSNIQDDKVIGTISIDEAHTWFDNIFLKEPSNYSHDSKLVREVFWDKAFKSTFSNNQDLIIVPIEHRETSKPANADTYLWIFLDDSKRISAKVVEYLSSIDENPGGINITQFTGAMTVRDWNGKLLNGFTFKDGKSVGLLLNVNGVETSRIMDMKSGRLNGNICVLSFVTKSTCTNFFYKVCKNGTCTELRPNDTPTFCQFYEITIPECYWVADFPGQTDPSTGGVNNNVTSSDIKIATTDEIKKIRSVSAELRCFNFSQNATVTIYSDQPVQGKRDTYYKEFGKDTDVGHTFISITQNGITRVIGYYPDQGASPFQPTGPSV